MRGGYARAHHRKHHHGPGKRLDRRKYAASILIRHSFQNVRIIQDRIYGNSCARDKYKYERQLKLLHAAEQNVCPAVNNVIDEDDHLVLLEGESLPEPMGNCAAK